MTLLLRCAAFGLLAAVIALTLGPVGVRSLSPVPSQVDRLAAFLVLGLLFSMAYPRHIWWVLAGLVAAAVGLEYAQSLRPERHAREADMLVKLAGAGAGVALGWLANIARRVRSGRNT